MADNRVSIRVLVVRIGEHGAIIKQSPEAAFSKRRRAKRDSVGAQTVNGKLQDESNICIVRQSANRPKQHQYQGE